MSGPRLIAVLGYSDREAACLHDVCAARLRRAEREARPDDVVLLSGWARNGEAASEAEHMARAWEGAAQRILLDGRARTTVGNVIGTAALVRRLDAGEVVLVTSRWHARRAGLLLRWALRPSGSTLMLAATDEAGSVGTRLRELACWALVPLGLLAVTKAAQAG
ncbi:MAG TPA: YdcF family protein [Gaiella sp.]